MRRTSLAVIAVLFVLSLAVAAPAQKRNIQETDIFHFRWIADPQISPDGARVAFVRVVVNEKRDGYDTSIWTVSTAGNEPPAPLTTGQRDTAPRWSPDGRMLLFLRGGEEAGKPAPPQIHLLPLTGGEPFAITDLPRGASNPSWSPDGQTILFNSTTSDEDLAKAARKKGAKPGEAKPGEAKPAAAKEEERESDVRVITRAIYRFNGQGYLDPKRRNHIWTVSVPAAAGEMPNPKQLTQGAFDEQNPTWSPDGKLIYFTATRVVEPYYDPATSILYSMPAEGGKIRRVTWHEGTIGAFAVSKDGKRIAFRGAITRPVRSYNEPNLYVAEAAPGATPRDAAPSLDGDVGSTLAGDQKPPRGGGGSRPVWSADGRSVIDYVEQQGRVNLLRFDLASGRTEPVTSGAQEVFGFSVTPDGSKTVAVISSAVNIGDLYMVEGGGKLTRLTDINRELFSQLNLTAPEEIWYSSFDGKKIQTWVQKPPDFQEGKKYPLILNIHGGPHAGYGHTFDHEFHWMAAKGYVVLYPNPRGSSGYGQEFGNIIQHKYPGDDHKDLMAGVDELIKRGYIDENKLGITGGSGGGVLTNNAITLTDRFKAAVSQRSISDWTSFWYTADFTLFTPSWFRGAPWQEREDFAARSAITNVEKIKTPLMLIEGEADLRTPPTAGGEQLFRALKFLRRPVVMVRFPDETHDLSRNGKPWHRVERLQHIVNWFDKYVLGADIKLYDLPRVESLPDDEERPPAKP
jgi:dipeptidyl aminopeptidase/acylaminoacyl peptidase